MFKLLRRSSSSPQPESEGGQQTTLSARPEVRKSAEQRPVTPARGNQEPIELSYTLPMRGRPEVLYRLALVPTRRAAWDSNMTESGWVDETQSLKNGARARFRLKNRLLSSRFEAEYEGLKPSKAGGWRSLKNVGPLEELSQHWEFRPLQGQQGTEVTLTVRGRVRFGWVRSQVERLLYNLMLSTLLDMQREIDAPTAARIQEMGEEAKRREEAERKAQKAARKAAKKRR